MKSSPLRGQPISLVIIFAIIVACGFLRVINPKLMEMAQYAVFDSYQRIQPREFVELPVTVVDIDDATLAKWGQWPWPRTLVASLVDELRKQGAASIVFDIVFAEADRTSPARVLSRLEGLNPPVNFPEDFIEKLPDNDMILADALRKSPSVLGFALTAERNDRLPEPKATFATIGPDGRLIGDRFSGAIPNLTGLEDAASGNGSLSFVSELDDIVRHVPLLQRVGDDIVPSLGVEALRVASGASTLKVRFEQEGGTLRVGSFDIPFDHSGRMMLHYSDPSLRSSIPAWQLLDSDTSRSPSKNITGHVILIGTSAAGLKDLRNTPMENYAAGVTVHAQAIEQMMLGKPLARPLWVSGAEVIVTLTIAIILGVAFTRLSARKSLTIYLIMIASALAISWLAYAYERLLVDSVWPILTFSALYLATITMTFARIEQEKAQIREAFSHYMAPSLVQALLDDPERLKLGGEARWMTFLFSDIAQFTALVEKAEPGQLIGLLNAYLDGICALVMDHGGTVDKIVGDAVHAIFNAPLDQPDHAERAVHCALAIDAFATAFSKENRIDGMPFGMTRIGINTGQAIVGNFGGSRRFDYTAHGDAINIAARLESANKLIGTRICVSGDTVAACPNLHFRPLGQFNVSGKSEPIDAFEALAFETEGASQQKLYRRAYDCLDLDMNEAQRLFQNLTEQNENDQVAQFYLDRCKHGTTGHLVEATKK